jgi:hypothetical protein
MLSTSLNLVKRKVDGVGLLASGKIEADDAMAYMYAG